MLHSWNGFQRIAKDATAQKYLRVQKQKKKMVGKESSQYHGAFSDVRSTTEGPTLAFFAAISADGLNHLDHCNFCTSLQTRAENCVPKCQRQETGMLNTRTINVLSTHW
jgi:hypothetical protein